jgi:hypothetical protein
LTVAAPSRHFSAQVAPWITGFLILAGFTTAREDNAPVCSPPYSDDCAVSPEHDSGITRRIGFPSLTTLQCLARRATSPAAYGQATTGRTGLGRSVLPYIGTTLGAALGFLATLGSAFGERLWATRQIGFPSLTTLQCLARRATSPAAHGQATTGRTGLGRSVLPYIGTTLGAALGYAADRLSLADHPPVPCQASNFACRVWAGDHGPDRIGKIGTTLHRHYPRSGFGLWAFSLPSDRLLASTPLGSSFPGFPSLTTLQCLARRATSPAAHGQAPTGRTGLGGSVLPYIGTTLGAAF